MDDMDARRETTATAVLTVLVVAAAVMVQHACACVTILERLDKMGDFTTLIRLIEQDPEARDQFNFPGTEVTLFAPTDAAFEAAFADFGYTVDEFVDQVPGGYDRVLEFLIKFHTVPEAIELKEYPDSDSLELPTNAEWPAYGSPPADYRAITVYMDGDGSKPKITQQGMSKNGTVTRSDVRACASFINAIDTVLTGSVEPPKGNNKKCMSIMEVAESTPILSTFARALKVNGNIRAHTSEPFTSVTMFAPNNLAFAKLARSLGVSVDRLFENPEVIEQLLSYHIVTTALPYEAIEPGYQTVLPTALDYVDGRPSGIFNLNVVGPGELVANENRATIVRPDLRSCASYVHGINEVLLPYPIEI